MASIVDAFHNDYIDELFVVHNNKSKLKLEK